MKKKIWPLIVLAVFLLVFSLGCEKETELKSESIIYPSGTAYGDLIFNVPESWIDGMKVEYNIPENYSQGELIFTNESGIFAGTKQVELTKEVKEVLKETFGDLLNKEALNKIDWEEYFFEFLETTHPKAKEIVVEEIEAPEGLLWVKGYHGKLTIDGKNYQYMFALGPDIYCFWSKNGNVDEKQLMKMMKSLRESDNPEDLWGKYEIKEFSGEWVNQPKELLETMLKDYISMDLPLERTIIGYKINDMLDVGVANDIPNILDDSVPYPDQSPWRSIYPSLKVYKVDYELIPYKPDRYMDTAGGGFEMTDGGNKRYPERYAVFAENVYAEHDNLSRLYFVGFIHPSKLAEYGLDASVLVMANQWYKERILPYCEELNSTDYVGDAMKVGSLIMSLPLKERINIEEGAFAEKALAIQTEKEPYGIVVNYWFESPIYDNTALASRDFDKSKILFPQVDINTYIKKQIHENMGYIFNGVKNVSRVTVNVWCIRGEDSSSYTKFTIRGLRDDFVEVSDEI